MSTMPLMAMGLALVPALGGCASPTVPETGRPTQGRPAPELTWTERRAFFENRLAATGCGVSPDQPLDGIIDGLEQCLRDHERSMTAELLREHPDEPFILAAVEEAIAAVRSEPREFGIGAVLVRGDQIIERAHNSQLGSKRTDLHAEMTLMTTYEERTTDEREGLGYPEDLRLYSSTEPCPMCFTRIVIAGLRSYYGAPSERDGMAHRADALPPSWAAQARRVSVLPARSSGEMNAIAETLFYSYVRFEQFAHLGAGVDAPRPGAVGSAQDGTVSRRPAS
jgi:cytosine deaminase